MALLQSIRCRWLEHGGKALPYQAGGWLADELSAEFVEVGDLPKVVEQQQRFRINLWQVGAINRYSLIIDNYRFGRHSSHPLTQARTTSPMPERWQVMHRSLQTKMGRAVA